MNITTVKISFNEGLRKTRRRLLIGGPVLFMLILLIIYIVTGRYVSTDDAYIQAAHTDISANISERVVSLAVRNNQKVHKGELLFKLDDRNYLIAVEEAKADLASTQLQIAALKATYLQRQADVQSAKDTLVYQEREFKRQQVLAAQHISSQAELDKAQHAFLNALQQLKSFQQQRDNTLRSLDNKPNIDINEHPLVLQAKARLERAELNLSYTVVSAPSDGVVTKVDLLQVGDYIKAADAVFSLVSTTHVWAEANFKETQLTNVHPGQNATISIDAYPGKIFHGKVVSTSPGTGSSFAVLPPENATGNWVKIVQRLPLHISIDDADPNMPLHMGLSATVEIDTHSGVRNKN